jgi:diguanylate cyclase (GGDEF)-like protein
MPVFPRRKRLEISPATYLELVRSLLGTLVPAVIMAVLFIVTAAHCSSDSPSSLTRTLGLLGSGVAIARVGLVLVLRTRVARRGLDVAGAQRLERIFAAIYLAFALLLGQFAASGMHSCPPGDQIVLSALVVGYAAGVAASVSLRPWIAVPAMLLSVTPAIAVSLAIGDTPHVLLAFVLSALMAGGIMSMLGRYRNAIEIIEMRQRFALLARRDPLTGLANRLALEDGFLRAVEMCGGKRVVLHCLDLDRFKPVNDAYGHEVGDLLLQAVAQRLTRLLREGDLAVRLGGDEFALLQTGIAHPDEAQLMARRIARAIAEPYAIDGHDIRIGASVGSASGKEHGPDLARLLSFADRALYEVKHGSREEQALAS